VRKVQIPTGCVKELGHFLVAACAFGTAFYRRLQRPGQLVKFWHFAVFCSNDRFQDSVCHENNNKQRDIDLAHIGSCCAPVRYALPYFT
jgi:hypothetical protein